MPAVHNIIFINDKFWAVIRQPILLLTQYEFAYARAPDTIYPRARRKCFQKLFFPMVNKIRFLIIFILYFNVAFTLFVRKLHFDDPRKLSESLKWPSKILIRDPCRYIRYCIVHC